MKIIRFIRGLFIVKPNRKLLRTPNDFKLAKNTKSFVFFTDNESSSSTKTFGLGFLLSKKESPE
jgi:hypothetical protein